MSHASAVPLLPFLRLLFEAQIHQEQKDSQNPQEAADRLRTPWERAAAMVLANLRVPGVNTAALRLHLIRVKFDGIHWPRFAGKTGPAFQAEFRASPLGGVESSTPLSSELARLDGEGFGLALAERLRLDYPDEINGILAELALGGPPRAEKMVTSGTEGSGPAEITLGSEAVAQLSNLTRYDKLVLRILDLMDGDQAPWPRTLDDLARDEERILLAVQEQTKVTRQEWEKLPLVAREPHLERVIAALAKVAAPPTVALAGEDRAPNTAGDPLPTGQEQKRQKRSTEKGEGRAKLIAALTNHHQYADGDNLNQEPIGNNELARLADVDQATASAFFKKQFKGHAQYKAMCADAGSLIAALKLLNGEFAPHHLCGSTPPDKGESDTEQ